MSVFFCLQTGSIPFALIYIPQSSDSAHFVYLQPSILLIPYPFLYSRYILLVMNKSNSTDAGIVTHLVYRVPKKNHDTMLRICKEAYDMFRQYGILHYDAFKLSNTDVPMKEFANIASVVSANQDEEVWIESIYYRDHQHMNEVMAKMEKDERAGQMMKQSMDLLPSGAKFIVGDFERLNV
jgi:uncharacterized protein YbaA (DUF1428 family)